MFTEEHIGRTVYDSVHCGEGKIIDFNPKLRPDFPVRVKFNTGEEDIYTVEGKIDSIFLLPTLSFTPYTLEGYTNTPPRSLPEVGEEILVSDNKVGWYINVFHKYASNNKIIDSNGMPWSYYKRFKEIE